MDELDPTEFHVINKAHRKWYIALAVFVAIVILPLFFTLFYRSALARPAQGHKEATFEIVEGESVSEVAKRLYDDSLINSAFLFKTHLVTQQLHTKIQAGVYRVPAGASIVELADLFQHGTNDVRITFLEGWRVEEYAREASNAFKKVDYAEFVNMAKDREGYLFPDTYSFNVDVGEREIVDSLSENFKEKTAHPLKGKTLETAGLTEEEAVILASIVEREVSDEEDRPIVAGILIKRWRNDELIGADATTQYAVSHLRVCDPLTTAVCPSVEQAMMLDWWPLQLSHEELDFDSVYNTRKVAGLPPKPICNPGVSALEAVANYKDTPYNFYLTDEDGITHYATTLEEHELNVSLHLELPQ